MGPRYRFCIGTGDMEEKGLESWGENCEKRRILHECGREESDLTFE